MSADQPLDRLLDVWLDEGPRVLPDRAFQAALEAVERTPQRGEGGVLGRQLSRIGTAAHRRFGPAGVVAIVAVAAISTATALSLLWRVGAPAQEEPPSVVFHNQAELKAVLLQPGEAPPGTEHRASGPLFLVSTLVGSELSEGWRALGAEDMKTWRSHFEGADDKWLTTFGLFFPDADAASQALALHRQWLPTWLRGEQSLSVPGLGEEGACYTSEPEEPGSHGAICLFRVGNGLFEVDATAVDADEVVRIARLVAGRAESGP